MKLTKQQSVSLVMLILLLVFMVVAFYNAMTGTDDIGRIVFYGVIGLVMLGGVFVCLGRLSRGTKQ